MMRRENCAERIRKGLSIKNMKASELCEKTGIPKSAMSQYINGKFEPKQDRLYLIAKALDVSEPWLMGFDVSMSSPAPTPEKEASNIDIMIASESKDLSDKDKHEILHLIQYKKRQTDIEKPIPFESSRVYTTANFDDDTEYIAAFGGMEDNDDEPLTT